MWTVVGQWSYTGDPAASSRDFVRFLVGDTDASERLCGNAEIDAAVAEASNKYSAAALIAGTIAARFAREYDKSVSNSGGQTVTQNYSQRATTYSKLATTLTAQAATASPAACRVGGISSADKDTAREDTDAILAPFTPEQFDNAG